MYTGNILLAGARLHRVPWPTQPLQPTCLIWCQHTPPWRRGLGGLAYVSKKTV